ncbi:L-ascorbate metabolism protein UlaG, beta-lactamase superfamily [Sphingomonas guangdongensis]|uniref:L-ascorbate metabolism protein UlaG, beta-lactamase superfamily n=1 Tax=Sphingomonas guangdongensis TaxID=1141890 RepID=A0A285QX18_9SPHN|nr:MBL fold metallo-hydrolase [Sphingomonas guangdongensis]SOB86510.1 L-ascorbate metabolism protein UlaG, beta-lactamase superfamily [Sphingomonas guangdongensis]
MTLLSILRGLLWLLLFLVGAAGFAATILPRFLDRVYYAGPRSDHFDGERFFNPDGDDDTAAPPGGGSRRSFLWRQLTGNDGRPAWPAAVSVTPARPDALLQPRAGQASAADGNPPMLATWVGHATVLVQVPGLNILTDPVWSERAGPFGFGPKRVHEPGIAFDDLPKVDVVLLSHNHYDHMDLATLKRLWERDRPLIVTPLGNDTILRGHGIDAVALDWGAQTDVPAAGGGAPIRVILNRAHHWGSRWGADRSRALWGGFVVVLPGGNLYFAGDTGFGDGRWADEAAAHGPIRLALIPIGAFRFVPGQMTSGSHIGPADAAEAYRRTGAARAIPIHWGTFRLSYEGRDTPPGLLAAATACTGQSGFDPVPVGVPQAIPPFAPAAPARAFSRTEILACLHTPAARTLK